MLRFSQRLLINSAILLISLISRDETFADPGTAKQELAGRNYYFSQHGNDNNDGRTPLTAWQTLYSPKWAAVSGALGPGDSVLFERGSYFFGTIALNGSGTENNPIVFSAYGSGAKPVLFAAEQIRDSLSHWKHLYTNYWAYKDLNTDRDVANLVLEDNSGKITYGKKIMCNCESELKEQGDFWYDYSKKQFEFYTVDSPQSIYRNIQFVRSVNAIEMGSSQYIVFENLDFRYYGKCVLETGGTNCTFKNLDISFIGGADQSGNYAYRFGNGLQLWAGIHNVTITGCHFDNVYDAAISPQTTYNRDSAEPYYEVYDIFMRNNLITNCEYSYEFFEWGRPEVHRVYFENNTCVNAGGGWSHNQRWGLVKRNPDESGPDPNGSHVRLERIEENSDDLYIRYNIFVGATERLYWIVFPEVIGQDRIGRKIVSDYNAFYQPNGKPFGTLYNFFEIKPYPAIDVLTLKAWQDSTEIYTSSTALETHSFYGDPKFISNEDFRLGPCSPLIEKGIELGNGIYFGAYPPTFAPDKQPPVITDPSAVPATLWPANHKMKEVAINYSATDNCEVDSLTLAVSSNQPVPGVATGDSSADWIVLDAHHVHLRADNSPHSKGRIYTIKITAKDAGGNVTTRSIDVPVRKSLGVLDAQASGQIGATLPEQEDGSFDCRVFPNPSSQYFDIRVTSTSNREIDVRLFDVTGRLITALKAQKGNTIRLDLDLQKGVYFVEIRQGDQFKSVRLIRQ